jgi:hypothetical protein
VQLPEQVSALPAQDTVQRFRITRLDGRHQLEEEVVAVAAGGHARLVQPAIEFRPSGLSDPVDQPVRLDRLRLALRLDQAVAGQAVEDLVEVPDVQPAPLLADRLLEAALQLGTVRGLVREES